MKSLADELNSAFSNDAFEDVDLSPPATALKTSASPMCGHIEVTDATRIVVVERDLAEIHVVQSKAEEQGSSQSPGAITNDISEPVRNFKIDESLRSPNNNNDTAKKTKFIEHIISSPIDRASKPLSGKEKTNLIASKHNRNLIHRNADGFFNMQLVPTMKTTGANVERNVQQEKGIAALQRTLVPVPAAGLLNLASNNGNESNVESSSTKEVDTVSGSLPHMPRKVTFEEPKDYKRGETRGRRGSATFKSIAAPRFSLGRELVVAGYKKRMAEPSAPATFVRLPTDPLVSFTRTFSSRGLRIDIPEPLSSSSSSSLSRNASNTDPGFRSSVTTLDGMSAALRNDKPEPKFHFGTPHSFLSDQCLESSCPIRFAHAKGPYHHKGQRQHQEILTGLFGHSNPPPEIWNAYRNMVSLTRDDSDREVGGDEDLVIAFAMFHYGGFNSMSGDEFHRIYKGKHTASMLALGPSKEEKVERALPRSESTTSFSLGGCLGHRK